MSPWSCPGAFTIIPYIEYGFGVYHVMGGLCKISHGMAKAAAEDGADIQLSSPVKKILVENRVAKGVVLDSGDTLLADAVVVNADFAHAMTQLVEPGLLRKYTPDNLRNREFSCSTFMLYLGVDKLYEDKSYDLKHNTIYFAEDYHRNLEEIAHKKVLSQDISFYVRNATVTDPGLAPPGHSALYVLVPVPNNQSRIDWDKERQTFRDRVIQTLVTRTPLKDLTSHIQAEEVITPWDWEKKRSVFLGATFNLAHTLGQMLYLRPRNAFEELGNCFLVGGGTHPGSGVPTILESGRISANLISQRFGIPFQPPKPFNP
jgi:phytoene desaturase